MRRVGCSKDSSPPTHRRRARAQRGTKVMDAIRIVEAAQLKKDRQGFEPGDQVRVHVKVIEGEKERTQIFDGTVIRKRGDGARASFTVRRISYGVGVERTFPLHSPRID